MLGLSRIRSPRIRAAVGTVAAFSLLGTTLAGAASLHRFTVSSGTGSLGAQTVVQSSATGGAFQAQTGSAADSTVPYPFAMFGEYNANGATTFGIGVAGVSTTGYGVAAEALGPNQAVYATNPNSSDAIYGVEGGTDQNAGVYAGVFGQSTGLAEAGIHGYDSGSAQPSTSNYGVGVFGESNNGLGGIFMSNATRTLTGGAKQQAGGIAYVGVQDGRGGFFASYGGSATPSDPTKSIPAISADSIVQYSDIMHGFTSYAQNANGPVGTTSFYIQGASLNRSGTVSTPPTAGASDMQLNGDVYLTGNVYTNCATFPVATTSVSCKQAGSTVAAPAIRTANGAELATYANRSASATMEDQGEARIVAGVARVQLDPAFASTISTRERYLVFITPEGDSALYVTNKTPTSFDVRQVGGGRGSLDFSYRIVAHPYGDTSARLAIVSRVPAKVAKENNADVALLARMRTKHATKSVPVRSFATTR